MMPNNFDMDDATKRVALENALKTTSTELYSLCINVNIDPDTIDLSDPEASFPEDATQDSNPHCYVYRRIITACSSHVMATNKLALLP
jgi:hypothetical protein